MDLSMINLYTYLFFSDLKNYLLKTLKEVSPTMATNIHSIHRVNKNNFPPHWHPNDSELGYVLKGTIEDFIGSSTGETAVFTVSAGLCYFISQSDLYPLNDKTQWPYLMLLGCRG